MEQDINPLCDFPKQRTEKHGKSSYGELKGRKTMYTTEEIKQKIIPVAQVHNLKVVYLFDILRKNISIGYIPL